jgi:transcriptional regulator with GAF, ATPase, and Fis domain
MPDIKSLPSPDNPEEALAAVVALRVVADKLERKTVKKAIEQGWSWSKIAEALGVTKQAAHKRHAAFIQKKKPSKKGGR